VIFVPYAEVLAERVVRVATEGKVFEVACGTGVLTKRLDAALAPDVSITATDLNEAMVAFAQEDAGASARVEWRQADAVVLPFDAESFDAVACQFGYMFVPDKIAAFREARRVLREGCPLLFSVWGPIEDNAFAQVAHETIGRFFAGPGPTFYQLPFSYHDPSTMKAHLESAGFVDVAMERVELPATARSAGAFARGLVEGNPIVNSIRDANLEIAPIIDAVEAELVRVGGDAPFRSAMRAWVVSARAGGRRHSP
jgi:ubiquinone/menaquinone biosynthesis C-methylase UbiE